jgi:hypothetical protein
MPSMKNIARVVVVATYPILFSACLFPADDRERASTDYADYDEVTPNAAGSAGTGGAGAAAEAAAGTTAATDSIPFTQEFAALIPNQVARWASVDVSITGVRHERGAIKQGKNVWGEVANVLDPAKVYVEIDPTLENKGDDEVDYSQRSTWDLLLADGRRLQSADSLAVTILPGYVATTSLHYLVDDMADLAGAELVLAGAERGQLEPEHLPLDAPYASEFPRRITTLVGQRVVVKNDLDVQVEEAVYDVNLERDGRALAGKRIVWLGLAFTNPHEDEESADAADVRLVVNGRASAPIDADRHWVDGNTTEVLWAHFEIDAAVVSFDIVIPTSDPAGARFPVTVASTAFASDL